MKKNKVVILICLCMFALSSFYVAKSINLFGKPNNSSQDYSYIKSTYDTMFENFESNKDYEALEQNLLDEIKDLNLLNTLSQDEILAILDECTNVGRLNVSNIVFSEIREISLSSEESNEESTEVSTELSDDEGDSMQSFPIEVIDVRIEFYSTYENMILFVNRLQNYESKISIASISILNKEEEEKVHCTIDLKFYAVKTVYAWLN